MRQSLLFMTSNGGGMGHLTRQLAVALAIGDRADATMFSLSLALPVATAHGVRGEYCPSHDRPWLKGRNWDRYLRDRVVAIATEIGASAIAFDGVAPFHGLLTARADLPRTAFVWIRRGMWRWTTTRSQLAKSALFDRVIQPADLADAADLGPTAGRTDAVRVPPITMLDVLPRLSREQAARELGIDPRRPTLLVTLGSGRLGDINTPGAVVVRAALATPDWQVCVTTAHIATSRVPLVDPTRVIELAGVYPLVRYLEAFDAVVSAAGYNAVHEFLPAGKPTLLVPNPSTLTDDQTARAHELARAGLALCADPTDDDALERATARLMDPMESSALASACASLPRERRSGGAAAAAGLLLDLKPRPGPLVRPLLALRLAAYGLGYRLLHTGARRAPFLLGRRSGAGRGRAPAPVTRIIEDPDAVANTLADETTLLFTDRISTETLGRAGPVEHILPGTSPAYRNERKRIIASFYEGIADRDQLSRAPPRSGYTHRGS